MGPFPAVVKTRKDTNLAEFISQLSTPADWKEEGTQEEQRLKNAVCLLGELKVATTVN